MIRIVCATRHDEEGFRNGTFLASCMPRLVARNDATLQAAFKNVEPLAIAYNAVIASAPSPDDVLVFVHDDVLIEDWRLRERLEDALERFDVVGVAGNSRRVPRQCSWAFGESAGDWDREHLRGSVGHVVKGRQLIHQYGPAPSEAKLLDGLFLAARASTLRAAGVEFDPRFGFHFYDLDFCRSCERAGLTMGVWPIAMTHASGGTVGSPSWLAAHAAYLEKWGE